MGTSQCGSAAGLGAGARVQVQCGILPEVDGRWWAHNGCTNQLEGWPLGPVGQTALGAGMAGMDRRVQKRGGPAGGGGGRGAVGGKKTGGGGQGVWASQQKDRGP